MKYIVGIDQSTQGTKAVLFDEAGRIVARADRGHKQIINESGWVSHDLEEIYQNTIAVVRDVVDKAGVDKADLAACGISNQRETTAMWNQAGEPLADAIVWQCSRAEGIVKRFYDHRDIVREKTGIPLSPFFPATKMRWLMENVEHDKDVHMGTIDSWLVYRLTKGSVFATDLSNASRTQLFNIHTLSWDQELCQLFGVPMDALAEIKDSNGAFGDTDFDGYLKKTIPIAAVMGDSHAALFGQGCHSEGMVKATYGTGSSIMMNTGSRCVQSHAGLATSLAWGMDGRADYVLEGNINYAVAVVTWMKDELGLIQSPGETEQLCQSANPEDGTVLVPAFSGLGAPYWQDDARAMYYGMSRTTGKAELVKAGVESIALQVADVVKAMEQDFAGEITELRVDGGPVKNGYLMQFESDMTGRPIMVSSQEELSAIGVAYMAGTAQGIYDAKKVFSNLNYSRVEPKAETAFVEQKRKSWDKAVGILCHES